MQLGRIGLERIGGSMVRCLPKGEHQCVVFGEERWAAHAAIDSATPARVLTAALFQRVTSRGESDLANRLLSAMRHQFGGHQEPPAHD